MILPRKQWESVSRDNMKWKEWGIKEIWIEWGTKMNSKDGDWKGDRDEWDWMRGESRGKNQVWKKGWKQEIERKELSEKRKKGKKDVSCVKSSSECVSIEDRRLNEAIFTRNREHNQVCFLLQVFILSFLTFEGFFHSLPLKDSFIPYLRRNEAVFGEEGENESTVPCLYCYWCIVSGLRLKGKADEIFLWQDKASKRGERKISNRVRKSNKRRW